MRRGNYLLLPKLAPRHVKMIAERLEDRRCSVRMTDGIAAECSEGSIRVLPAGICRSSFDAADYILPAIPEILDSPREKLTLVDLQALYFRWASTGSRRTIRFSPRMESSTLWWELRAAGDSALAPDEHSILKLLISRSSRCRLVTDFPVDGSMPTRIGSRLYFDAKLGKEEAATTLRRAGERLPRSSYITKDSLLELHGFSPPSEEDLLRTFSEASDWCCFIPS